MNTIELSAALGQAQVVENLKNFVGVDAQGAAALMTPERLAAVAGELAYKNLGASITDLNEMKTTGQFRGYKWVNGPTGETQIGLLIVGVYSPDWICQIYISISETPQAYIRGYRVSKWGAWKQVNVI